MGRPDSTLATSSGMRVTLRLCDSIETKWKPRDVTSRTESSPLPCPSCWLCPSSSAGRRRGVADRTARGGGCHVHAYDMALGLAQRQQARLCSGEQAGHEWHLARSATATHTRLRGGDGPSAPPSASTSLGLRCPRALAVGKAPRHSASGFATLRFVSRSWAHFRRTAASKSMNGSWPSCGSERHEPRPRPFMSTGPRDCSRPRSWPSSAVRELIAGRSGAAE